MFPAPTVIRDRPVDLSCVILSFNSARCIHRCVQSLVDSIAELGIRSEIWVVDNGSTDSSLDSLVKLAARESSVKIIRLDRNYGTTASRNQALSKAVGAQILVLDSDAYMTADALKGLRSYLVSNPKVGLVAPKLVFPDGRPQLSVDQFPTIPRKIERILRLRQLERVQVYSVPTEVDYAISACWMMSRQVFETVGMLDESIFYAPEDVDYCLRVWQAGFRVVYHPGFLVIHDAQERSRRLLPNRFTWLHLQGLAYYFRKHKYCWDASGIRSRVRGGVGC